MLDLSDKLPFAQGYNRLCYEHPLDSARCLKIVRPENIATRAQRQSRLKQLLGTSRLNDNTQEIIAHNQRAIRNLVSKGHEDLVWAHLPKFYGNVQTSRGEANESELIRCANGCVAPTLETLIRDQGLTQDLEIGIEELIDWLKQTRILTRNLIPHNLVVTDRAGRIQLFLVDGLGAPTIPQALAPLPGWSSHYIDRKIDRFRKRLAWEQNTEGLSWEDFQRLR
jgi:hypothetical protein